MRFYEVGGAVRDHLMAIDSKDVDFAVEAESFGAMESELKRMGFTIFLVNPEYLTIRAQVPKDSPLFQRTKAADFVLCRKDGPTKDGRRPEYVEPGTIYDDLARRDFTINAIARDPDTGDLIDPYGGARDIEDGILRFVGDPMSRILEDGLRVVRGLRFMVTKTLKADEKTWDAMRSEKAVSMIGKVSEDRIREELTKMFEYNTLEALRVLGQFPSYAYPTIFRGIRLTATQKKK